MSIKPEVLDAMLAAGVTAEQLVQILKAEHAAHEADRAARREKAAAKKRRQRAARAQLSPDVPGTMGDIEGQLGTEGDTPSPSPDGPLSLPHTPTQTPLNPPSPSPDLCPKPRVRTTNDPLFDEFWEKYPRDRNMSKHEAFTAWRRLSETDRRAAVDSVESFVTYCRANPDYRPIHANRYVLKRRFDGHGAALAGVTTAIWVEEGSPQWEAWTSHSAAKGERKPIALESRGYATKGRHFHSEWPPGFQAYREAAE